MTLQNPKSLIVSSNYQLKLILVPEQGYIQTIICRVIFILIPIGGAFMYIDNGVIQTCCTEG